MGLLRVSCQNFSCMILIMSIFAGCGTGMTLQIRFSHHKESSGRIVNGQNALPGMFPHLVSIQFLHVKHAFCLGAILDPWTIVTAAHCFVVRYDSCKDNENCYKIVAGEYDLSKFEGHEQEVAFTMDDVVIHEYYDHFHYDHDIALIRLPEPLKFTHFVKSIPLINSLVEHTSTAVIAGWGKNESNSIHDVQILQKTQVEIFSNQYCHNQWGDDYHQETMICAGAISQSPGMKLVSDACQGDSGGPLVTLSKKTKRRYLVGLISWGFDCGFKEYPGLYTKVEGYLEWIQKNMQRQSPT